MDVISDCAIRAIVNAPIEKINLTEWLFTLKEHEYQACSVAHIAAGTTMDKDGKRMSLNVELVGAVFWSNIMLKTSVLKITAG
jgi:hypothetical protein